MESRIRKRLILPSQFFLLVVLVTGVWIRVQWTWPEFSYFNAKFLIHSHSHLALLGWVFPALMGLMIRKSVSPDKTSPLLSLWILIPLLVIIVLMSIAFAIQGYAFWSITLSTLYIFLTSVWIILLLIRMEDDGSAGALFLKLAAFSYLASNIGPLALSGGTMFGETWIMFWVSYYLHFQFDLWIPLAIFSILLYGIRPDAVSVGFNKKVKTAAWIYAIGSVFLTESMTRMYHSGYPEWIGLSGSVAVILSTGFLSTLAIRVSSRVPDTLTRVMIKIGIMLFLLKAGMQVIASLPEVGIQFIQNHFLKIGFTHMVLLGAYTFMIYGLIRDITSTRDEISLLKRPSRDNNNMQDAVNNTGLKHNMIKESEMYQRTSVSVLLRKLGMIAFMTGSLVMIAILFILGMSPITGFTFPYPVQESLLVTGLITLVGFSLDRASSS